TTAVRERQHQEHSQDAAANWRRAPKQPLNRRRSRAELGFMRWQNPFFGPQAYVSVIVNLFFTPSGKGQQRLVISVANKNVFDPVLVGMFQDGAQRFHAAGA